MSPLIVDTDLAKKQTKSLALTAKFNTAFGACAYANLFIQMVCLGWLYFTGSSLGGVSVTSNVLCLVAWFCYRTVSNQCTSLIQQPVLSINPVYTKVQVAVAIDRFVEHLEAINHWETYQLQAYIPAAIDHAPIGFKAFDHFFRVTKHVLSECR